MCRISRKGGIYQGDIELYQLGMYLFFFALLQASSTVEVDIQTAEKLQVSRLDFMTSLNNDIKPVSLCVHLCLFLS